MNKLALLGFSTFFMINSINAKELSTAEIQENMLLLKRNMESTLFNKSHILSKELTGTLEGSIQGSLDGQFSNSSRVSSMLGKAVLGALALPAIGMSAPALIGPMGLSSILGTAAVGAGGGAAIGALTPEQTMKGSISGKLDGKISGENWENLKSSNSFVMTVLDPNQLNIINQKAEGGSNYSECTAQYAQNLKALVNSRRFITVKELKDFLNNAARFSSLANDLEMKAIKMSSANKLATLKFLEQMNNWKNKKININLVGLNDLSIKTKSQVKVQTNLYTAPDGNLRINEKTIVPAFVFASEDFAKNSINLVIDSVQKAMEKAWPVSDMAFFGYTEEGKFEFIRNRRDSDLRHNSIRPIANNRLFVNGVYTKMDVRSLKFTEISSASATCSSIKDLKNLLNETSVSEDLLLDSITERTADDLLGNLGSL